MRARGRGGNPRAVCPAGQGGGARCRAKPPTPCMAAPVLPIARLRGNGATLRGGVGGPGMNWMTVYDVRNVAAVTPLWYMAGAAFVFFGLPGLYLLRPGSGARS